MIEGTDRSLLDRFATRRDEAAFRALVGRHLALVHSTARRVTVNEALARDVAQATFVRLAERAAMIPAGVELAAWLHRTTRSLAIDLVRRETRRRKYEASAATMETPCDDSEWPAMAPVIDELVDALPATDRQLLILRYYRNEPHAAVAASFGLSEVATRKRTSRALEKLRVLLGKRGIATSASALAMLLPAHAATPAPAALMTTVVSAAQGVAPLIPSGLKAITLAMNATQKSLIAGAGALFLVSFGYAVRPVATSDLVASSSPGSFAGLAGNAAARSPRAARPLPTTPEERMQRLAEILNIRNSALRQSEMVSFLDRLPPAEYPAVWEKMNSPDDSSGYGIDLLASLWSRTDALALLAAMEKGPNRFDGRVLRALGVNDPAAGLAWVRSKPEPRSYSDLLAGMAAVDLPGAMKLLASLPEQEQAWTPYFMYTSMKNDPDALSKLWNALGPGPGRTEMLVKAADFVSGSDPAVMFATLEKDPVALERANLSQLYNNWALSDPAAAAESLARLPANQLKGAISKTTNYIAIQSGSKAAYEVLTRFPDQCTDEATRTIIFGGATSRPEEALELLPKLAGSAMRQETQSLVLDHWLQRHPTGAREWMTRHGMPADANPSATQPKAPSLLFR